MINLEALTIEELFELKENITDELNKKIREKYNRFEIVNREGNISYQLSQLLPDCNIAYKVVTTEMPHCCGTIIIHVPKEHVDYEKYLKIIKEHDDI